MDMPRLSRTEAEILRLLVGHGELYGLELVNRSDSLKRGTVYVTLARMADKGYVTSRPVGEKGDGPQRRVYAATGLGVRAIRAWAAGTTAMEAAWSM